MMRFKALRCTALALCVMLDVLAAKSAALKDWPTTAVAVFGMVLLTGSVFRRHPAEDS